MEPNKKTYIWAGVGIAIAVIIVYFSVSSGVNLTGKPKLVGEKTDQGVVAVPGTNPISEETGQVLTKKGEPVKQDVQPGTPDAPQQSGAISSESLPPTAVQLTASGLKFTPSSFTVKKGAPVTLSVTAEDKTYIFKFNDPSLSAVAIGVGPGETRAITFNAPDKIGEYSFYSDVPGHVANGAIGTMTVK